MHWHSYLLCFGSHSPHLLNAVAMLAHHLANVEWDDNQALMASDLIALNKCPGVCLIGVGEAL